MEALCSVCNVNSIAFTNIFNERQQKRDCTGSADMIAQVIGYVVGHGDSLPEHICPSCQQNAVGAFNLLKEEKEDEGQDSAYVPNTEHERPYNCSGCSKSFAHSTCLWRHMKMHMGQRRYQCAQCPAWFLQKPHLRTHARTHTGERPYKCNQCDMAFTQSGNLLRHKIRAHT